MNNGQKILIKYSNNYLFLIKYCLIKVKSVIVELKDLINVIKSDQKSRMKVEEPISINIFSASNDPDQSTTGLNGHFVHSLLLIDVLIRMKSIENDKKQLITLCKKEYENNNKELILLREFEKEYKSENALWWYTRESFLYRMLNKALRIQNIDLLFLFRFVIADIYQQLKQNQYESSVRVYRGQIMSKDELNVLRQSIGNLISINSFFSTSINRQKALRFLNSSVISKDFHRILFVIDANSNVVKSKPFADISLMSDFSNESEVLFMIGCVFRLINIQENKKEEIWMIEMELCGDDQHDLEELFHHMKNKYGGGNNEVNLLSFGDVLHEMGKYNLAEKMYHRLLNELPQNDPSLGDLYWVLGSVTEDKGEYDSSLEWFNKSLDLIMKRNSSDYVNIGGLYNSIGEVYRKKNNLTKALEYYNKAVQLFQQAHDDNHPHMSHFYNNIAIIYWREKKYEEALEYYGKSLNIKQKHLPSDHPDIAGSYNNIGGVHFNLNEYDRVMEYYERALKIYLKSLPPEHPKIAMSYESIGGLHEHKCEFEKALRFYEKAAIIYRHSLPSQHPDVIRIEEYIKDVS